MTAEGDGRHGGGTSEPPGHPRRRGGLPARGPVGGPGARRRGGLRQPGVPGRSWAWTRSAAWTSRGPPPPTASSTVRGDPIRSSGCRSPGRCRPGARSRWTTWSSTAATAGGCTSGRSPRPCATGTDGADLVIVVFTGHHRRGAGHRPPAKAEAQLDLALEHAPSSSMPWTREGRITLARGAGLRRCGPARRSGGPSALRPVPADPAVTGCVRRALAGETVVRDPAVGRGLLRRVRDARARPRGRITGVIGVSTDVTQQRRLQARAIQNDRVMAMGTLAASVAHEINNPLSYILGSLDEIDRAWARPRTRTAVQGQPGGGARRRRADPQTSPGICAASPVPTTRASARWSPGGGGRGAGTGAQGDRGARPPGAEARGHAARCGPTRPGWCRWC